MELQLGEGREIRIMRRRIGLDGEDILEYCYPADCRTMSEVQRVATAPRQIGQRLRDSIDRSIAELARHTNEDLRNIVQKEMEAIGRRKAPRELEEFWIMGAALTLCLSGIVLVYFRLPQ